MTKEITSPILNFFEETDKIIDRYPERYANYIRLQKVAKKRR